MTIAPLKPFHLRSRSELRWARDMLMFAALAAMAAPAAAATCESLVSLTRPHAKVDAARLGAVEAALAERRVFQLGAREVRSRQVLLVDLDAAEVCAVAKTVAQHLRSGRNPNIFRTWVVVVDHGPTRRRRACTTPSASKCR